MSERSVFDDLPQAPKEIELASPETAKKPGPVVILYGHWGPIGLMSGKNPGCFAQIRGLNRTMLAILEKMPEKDFEQRGLEFLEGWAFRYFDPKKKMHGQLWQADIGKSGTPLALCRMPGAAVKLACNEHYGRLIFEHAVEYLLEKGFQVKGQWSQSGFKSAKNVLKICVAEDQGTKHILLYGNPTFVNRHVLNGKYEDFLSAKKVSPPSSCATCMPKGHIISFMAGESGQ